jgi:hypothetical protein
VKKRLNRAISGGSKSSQDVIRLTKLVRLLEEHDAKSFYLFPVKGLTGNVEGDIIAFHDSVTNTTEGHPESLSHSPMQTDDKLGNIDLRKCCGNSSPKSTCSSFIAGIED